jgi:hypothetical protein
VVYDILSRVISETLRTIAADPKHPGAEIGFFAVLCTCGQNLLHRPTSIAPYRGWVLPRRQALQSVPTGFLSLSPGCTCSLAWSAACFWNSQKKP